MKRRLRTRVGSCVALAAMCAASLPATAADLRVGVQTGLYLPRLEPLSSEAEEPADSATSYFVAPSLTLQWAHIGIGARYLFSPYRLFDADLRKHDIDVVVRYRFNPYIEALLGARMEIQKVTAGSSLEFNLYTFPVAVVAGYPIQGTGLTPFVVGAILPFAVVGVDTLGGERETLSGFGGFAAEAGLAYSLQGALEVPLGISLSYRFQQTSLEKDVVQFKETIQQVSLGLTYSLSEVLWPSGE